MKRRAAPSHHLVGGSCCNQKKGEDRFVADCNFQAVFDGHRGDSVAEFASINFFTLLQKELSERQQSREGEGEGEEEGEEETMYLKKTEGTTTSSNNNNKNNNNSNDSNHTAATTTNTTATDTTIAHNHHHHHHHHHHQEKNKQTSTRDSHNNVVTFEEATDALRRTFHRCHEEARSLEQMSGTTAVVFWSCLVCTTSPASPRTRRVGLCANAGDSRAVLR